MTKQNGGAVRGVCSVCGCTEDRACPGGCAWANKAQTLCTTCSRGSGDARPKQRRGFASMSKEKQRAIASKGGRAAHEQGTAHEFTTEEARAAGRKGGMISRGGRGRLPEGEVER